VLAAVGALHLYWAAGGQRARLAAVPEMEGRPLIAPGPLGCVAVGVSLFFAAALVSWAAASDYRPAFPKGQHAWGRPSSPPCSSCAAVGDRKYVGFFKRVRDTEFARRDSRIYSPLCLLLGLGAAAIVVS